MAASSSSGSMASSSNVSTPGPASFPFATNLTPLTLRLDCKNYNFWRAQVLPYVHAHNLEGFLLGSVQRPNQFLTASDSNDTIIQTLNPDYITWNRQDQYLVS